MNNILCATSAYTNKHWLNNDYNILPISIKNELKILTVLFVEKVGGSIILRFDDLGNLMIDLHHEDSDYLYDDIGARLEVKKLQEKNRELFEKLEMYEYARREK